MGGACSKHGSEKCIQDFGSKRLEGRNSVEELRPAGRKISEGTLQEQNGSMEWINLARDRDRWRDLVNTVMKLLPP